VASRFRWLPTAGATGRYQDKASGRFVSGDAVRVELDRFIDSSAAPSKALAEQLRDGSLNVTDWETGMRKVVKNTHLNSIAEARGGYENMTQADYGRAGQIIREQYGYLHKFGEDIANGTQPLDGRLDARSELYVKAGRESYYKANQAAAVDSGLTHVRSNLNPADHCVECVKFDGKWFELGSGDYKLPGQRICNKNCKCDEEYGTMVDGVIRSASG